MTTTSILVVDDDDVQCESLCRLLGAVYEVRTASTADEALALWKSRPADCLLIDYRLPDATGIELLERLPGRRPATLMMTGVGDERIAVRAIQAGFQDYLVKRDLDSQTVARAIRAAIVRRDRERQIEAANEELRSFAGTVAHDLRAPLRHIAGFTSIAEKALDQNRLPSAKQALGTVRSAAARLSALVDALLAYARVDSANREMLVVHLGDLLENLRAEMHETLTAAGAVVHLEELPAVLGDPALLGELFQNLFDNGLKYRSDAPPELWVSARREDSRWVVCVADNGVGIEPAARERAFAPLDRAGRTQSDPIAGVGLGLYTCRRIAERHGGRIWAEDRPGGGVVIAVSLPEAPPASGARPPAS